MSLACWGLVVLFWDFVFHFHQLSVFRQNTLFSDTTGNLVFVSHFTRKLAFSISKAQNMAFDPPASSNCNFSSVLNAKSLFPAPKKVICGMMFVHSQISYMCYKRRRKHGLCWIRRRYQEQQVELEGWGVGSFVRVRAHQECWECVWGDS